MELKQIPVNQIRPNPDQPRKRFDEQSLNELAASIRERGVLQPLLVESADDGYILHAGERRLRAALISGLAEVPAQVLPPLNGTGRRERIINAYVENALREDMTPVEEARAIAELRQLGLTNTDIMHKTGVNINTIAGRLLILELETELQDLIATGQMPRDPRAIRALLSIEDSATRVKLGKRLARPGVSINAIVNACSRLNEQIQARQAVTKSKTPIIALSDATKQSDASFAWSKMRVAAQAMCDQCDVKASLRGVPEPAWTLIVAMAEQVCDGCSLRTTVNMDVCKQCPGVDLLSRLVANV